MARAREPLLRVAALGFAALLIAGCASPSQKAGQFAARMLHPHTSPRKSLRFRGRLIELAPHSDRYLADAFFPIGLYDVPESALPEIAAAGFNLVVNGGRDGRYLSRAAAAGVRVIAYVPLDRMRQEIENVETERALFAWYPFDEPDLNGVPPQEYRRLATELRKLDRNRPVFLTVWAPNRYGDFVEASDIFAPNPYPITDVDPEKNDLRRVARTVDAARAAAEQRPVWAIVQAFWAEPWWPRNPTPDELRAMVFLALNHGADGIIYFSYNSGDRPITQHAQLFDAVREVNGQLRALRGALLVRPEKDAILQELVGDEAEADATPAESAAPPLGPLDCSLRSYRGAQLLIAVNPEPAEKQVRLFIPGARSEARVSELFGDQSSEPVTLPAGAPLTVSFKPHETRIFWIE